MVCGIGILGCNPPWGAVVPVIPAQAGIQEASMVSWTPVFTGVTESASHGVTRHHQRVSTHTRLKASGPGAVYHLQPIPSSLRWELA